MAPPARADVVFSSLKNCLVNLPSPLVSLLASTNSPAQDVLVELQYRTQTLTSGAVSSGNAQGFQRSAYVGWTGMPARTRPASLASTERSRPGGRDQDLQTIEIDSTFAKVLGLSEGQRVGILLHLDPPTAHTVNIEPLTPADWETIELHANFLELNLLSQIRALPNPNFISNATSQNEHGHPLALHLSPTSTANIMVTSLKPEIPSAFPFAKIAGDAEVIVAPKMRSKAARSTRGDSRSIASRRSNKSGASTTKPGPPKKPTGHNALFYRGMDRAVASRWFDEAEEAGSKSQLRIWLHKDALATDQLRGARWAGVSIVKPSGLRAQLDQTDLQKLKEQESSEAGLPATKIVAYVSEWRTAADDQHVVLSSQLCLLLGLGSLVGSIIRVEPSAYPLQRYSVQTIKFYPFLLDSGSKKDGLRIGGNTKLNRQALIDRLRSVHGGEHGLLSGPVTEGMILPPSKQKSLNAVFEGGMLRFDRPKEQKETKSTAWALGSEQQFDIEVKSEIPKPLPLTTLFPTFAHGMLSDLPGLVGVDKLVKECLSNLSFCSSVLLTGAIGSGKTAVAHGLCQRLREEYLFSTSYFACSKLTTDETRVSTIKDDLTKLFMTASWSARLGGHSLVVLDDLDKICPVETELQVGNDNGRSRQVTELLCGIIRQYCSVTSGVTVLATAQSKEALNNIIIGGHVVGDIVPIHAPDKEIRRKILSRLTSDRSPSVEANGHHRHVRNVSDSNSVTENSWMDPSNPSSRPGSSSSSAADGFHISPNLDLLDVAGKTDGYMPADLMLLVSRARNEALIRNVTSEAAENSLTLSQGDFEAALKNFTPSSLRNVTLTHSTTTFAAVGGLRSTRNTLLETLLYPTKYAPIFAKSPLRLRSGILLYGYPGCGKTLLASAVAGECNLNFISVKGPEILNKYIGASEKSVRDLFERAQAAKPCVLFFDEFDSIAPKRGHDSTGVTDRVVNQMLTQMDGAEGLEGVYVLAATSRPDLIDPALLRPGRLDKSLLCDMPTLEDREDIIRAVSEKLVVTQGVQDQLPEIARRTEGLTGADLQALMYNAHLAAIHELLGESQDHKKHLTNGTRNSRSHSDKNRKGGKHDFIQFLYGADEDVKARSSVTSPALDSRAAIAAKLDELKLARKRERQMLKGHTTMTTSDYGQDSKVDTKDEQDVIITWKHIESSLASTRSSISPQERRRLASIYREFVVGRNGEMPSGQGGTEIGGRSSLM